MVCGVCNGGSHYVRAKERGQRVENSSCLVLVIALKPVVCGCSDPESKVGMAEGDVTSRTTQCSEELKEQFLRAAQFLQSSTKDLSPVQLLYLYARYKQAQEGPCIIPKPSFFDLKGRQKWEAWKQLGDMSSAEAMQDYIHEIETLFPAWNPKDQKRSSTGFGQAVSRLQDLEDETLTEDQKGAFDWVKEGNINRLKQCLRNYPQLLEEVDSQGMTLLHWACDRGAEDIVQLLLKAGTSINKQDREGQTALHYASSCGHRDLVRILLEHGADATLADDDGQTPRDAALECSDLFPPS